ncbi:bifunctional phosphopantothenoylcysteine decarboxylase/phosphopantothenate--cysteine ligase CoaBC [Clostridium grantii]|uniref:Coenzyme A biosynthesis bifunctional protein CoaBC n=1 Tax=Clostridium grantii DSM 8605 TaxID=1121316 RepID=A0A1M5QSX5_9CLOT|nr:bifunctional phosphopantothenoylcysteine decarboxylase/phosphopantothenate--cysteine ligase CoaBC [Clostridium grantii]SHH17255.1 phosphopantothenoylcysteine decarboxylase / phosphopantothenate--cysteine ligase [Clostridium grantii DSM 8605]
MGEQKTVVIGVTGGIAAYKALDLVSKLKKSNFNVHVIMTKSAAEFVNPLSFQSLSQNFVIKDMFEDPKTWDIEHISLAKKADVMIICPATVNIIGKVANGIADDMLSTTIMATKAPVIFAPAANSNMYLNAIVQDNINKLKGFGYKFIEPDSGRLACGDEGKGKLANIDVILENIKTTLYDLKDLKGKKVLVTAGPTISFIDPVRFITNKSSGKMGYAIAEEARDRGAHVTLISGPSNEVPPIGVDFLEIQTNSEMRDEVLKIYDSMDVVVKAAAVADYKIAEYSEEKIKKQNDELSIKLIKDVDILQELGKNKKTQILIGFAAESENLINNAKAKMEKKNLDYIVANNIKSSEIGFNSMENVVTIIKANGKEISLEKMTKRLVARELFNIVNDKKR